MNLQQAGSRYINIQLVKTSIFRRFRNDFYPFIYPELATFDPSGLAMVRTVFGCGEREEAAAALCPPDYAARRYPVWRMGAGRGLATFLLASPLATLAPIQLGRTRKLDI